MWLHETIEPNSKKSELNIEYSKEHAEQGRKQRC